MNEKPDRPDDGANVIPLRQRQRKQPRPREIETCPHGVPYHLDCAECHGIGA